MKNVFVACLFAFISLITSCQTSAQKREDQNIKGFTALNVSSGIDVYLSQSSTESVEIEADEDILSDIIVEVDQNNALTIKLDRNWGSWFSGNDRVKAYISFKSLTDINVSGGSDLYGQGPMEFQDLEVNASGGADVKLSLKANELFIRSSGGSDMTLEGYVAYLEGSSSGGSDIKAKELETEVANLSSSGGSDIHVKVNRELIASASGGSDIFYYGNPEKTDLDESGGSDITKK